MSNEVKKTIQEIRDAISRCKGSEKELYEELDAEHEGWMMRLDEIARDEEDEWKRSCN